MERNRSQLSVLNRNSYRVEVYGEMLMTRRLNFAGDPSRKKLLEF